MSDGFLQPRTDESSEPFWRYCADGELRIQACNSCGRRRMPPRPMCPWCHSLETRWDLMSGAGRVWSFVIVHPPLLAAYAAIAPYNVVVVELDADPTIRLLGNLVTDPSGGWDAIDHDPIEIGEAVQVTFDAGSTTSDDEPLPRWVRVTAPLR